jgi:hypothetical protein
MLYDQVPLAHGSGSGSPKRMKRSALPLIRVWRVAFRCPTKLKYRRTLLDVCIVVEQKVEWFHRVAVPNPELRGLNVATGSRVQALRRIVSSLHLLRN